MTAMRKGRSFRGCCSHRHPDLFLLVLLLPSVVLRSIKAFRTASRGSRIHSPPSWRRSIEDFTHRRRDSTRLHQSEASQSHSNSNIDENLSPSAQETRSISPSLTSLSEVDVLYGRHTDLVYDPTQERYVNQKRERQSTDSRSANLLYFLQNKLIPRLSVAFLPSGVTQNYFAFVRWRVLQRFINANLHVFGTQSLLLGLGIKSRSSQLGALSAALNWVLKDALGKIVRMLWASRMGRRFDSDAKRWRFRSSFVFAAGNGLEIVTYVFPNLFLLWATLANCCKQVSMLTSSSTRTAIYNSFRDGTRENIGDITAKGEAQIAIVDLLGIASGVTLSRAVGASVRSVLAVYVCLQILEIFCVYRQLRTVEYRVLNFERLVSVISDFCGSIQQQEPQEGVTDEASVNGSVTPTTSIKTPQELAVKERIFLPPRHLTRRAIAFGSLGRAKLSPAELNQLLDIFSRERFLLVVGQNIKHPSRFHRPNLIENLQENCHIVLHSEATNMDIVKSTLALILLRRKLATRQDLDPKTMRSADCMSEIVDSLQEADRQLPLLIRQMAKQGWESPARFLFGR